MESLLLRLVLKHYHPKTTLVAIITRGGRILAIGKNRSKGLSGPGLCAERDALKRCKNPAKATIWVIRIRKDGSIGCSKPCLLCRQALQASGISKVHYIGDNDKWKRSRIDSI